MGQINFACQTFPIDKILRCSFNLNNTEFQVLKYLLRSKKPVSVREISNAIKKDRTTAQRAIHSLMSKDLVRRRQYNLKSGGYVYYYYPTDKESIKKQVREIFERFNNIVLREIESW